MNKKVLSIICFFLTIVFIVFGILLLPNVTDIGAYILYYVLSIIILCYVFLYLMNIAVKNTGKKQIITIIEMVLDIVIAVALVCNEIFTFIVIKDVLVVIGIVMWLHGAFSLFSEYFSENKTKIYGLIFNVLLISIATIMISRPFITTNALLISVSVATFVLAILALVNGLILLKAKKHTLNVN